MAQVIKTFTWDANAESWVFQSVVKFTGTWQSTGGNPNGCINCSIAGRNSFETGSYWYLQGTWEDMGVPAGATVTNVQLTDCDTKMTAWTTVTSYFIGPFELRSNDGATLYNTLWAGRTPTGVEGTWTSSTGTNQAVPSAIQASNSSFRFRFDMAGTLGNDKNAIATHLSDNLELTITYNAPVSDLNINVFSTANATDNVTATPSTPVTVSANVFSQTNVSDVVTIEQPYPLSDRNIPNPFSLTNVSDVPTVSPQVPITFNINVFDICYSQDVPTAVPSVPVIENINVFSATNVADNVTVTPSVPVTENINIFSNAEISDVPIVVPSIPVTENVAVFSSVDVSDNITSEIAGAEPLSINVYSSSDVSDSVDVTNSQLGDVDVYSDSVVSGFINSAVDDSIISVYDSLEVSDYNEEFLPELFIDVWDDVNVSDISSVEIESGIIALLVDVFDDVVVWDVLLYFPDSIYIREFIAVAVEAIPELSIDVYDNVFIQDTIEFAGGDLNIDANDYSYVSGLVDIISSDKLLFVADYLTVQDNISAENTEVYLFVSDNVNVYESINVLIAEAGAVYIVNDEVVFVFDVPEVLITELFISVFDSLTAVDNVVATVDSFISVSDNVYVSDYSLVDFVLLVSPYSDAVVSDVVTIVAQEATALNIDVYSSSVVTGYYEILIPELSISLFDNVFVQGIVNFDNGILDVIAVSYTNVSDLVQIIISDNNISTYDVVYSREDVALELIFGDINVYDISVVSTAIYTSGDTYINILDTITAFDFVSVDVQEVLGLNISAYDLIVTEEVTYLDLSYSISVFNNIIVTEDFYCYGAAQYKDILHLHSPVLVEEMLESVTYTDMHIHSPNLLDDYFNSIVYLELELKSVAIAPSPDMAIDVYDTVNISDIII